MRKKYFVYIICSDKNGTLYTGMTSNLNRRMYEHFHGLISGFTAKYGIFKLVYYEQFDYVNDAIQREKQIKNWNRAWKIRLIESVNPTWKNFYVSGDEDNER